MSISIAGRAVKVGDSLYHSGYRTWGTVQRFDTNSAVVRITGANGDTRDLFVTEGGVVGNVRQMFWHEPLQLDLPYQDVQAFQRLLNAAVGEWA